MAFQEANGISTARISLFQNEISTPTVLFFKKEKSTRFPVIQESKKETPARTGAVRHSSQSLSHLTEFKSIRRHTSKISIISH